MLEFLVTCTLFNLTVCLIPLLILSFIVLRISQLIWLNCMAILHPEVEFLKYSTIRTLLDTHRNQGIISVLLSVKGQADPEAVRRHLQEVVRRRDKTGGLAFPRLRHCLVTKCGTYAWEKGSFDLDQNLTVAPFTYKGRAVTDYNIQEYVSDIVSKYLSPGIPPWQVIIIPSSEDHHYILFKLHHVLLSEGLNIGDLLPLIPPTRQNIGISNANRGSSLPINEYDWSIQGQVCKESEFDWSVFQSREVKLPIRHFTSKSPLVEVFKKPVVIPVLKERLTEELANRWNEFVSNYDPLERPELFKSTPTFLQFQAIMFITLVSLVRECRKGFRVIKEDAFSKIKYILVTAKRETNKRQVTVENLILSCIISMDPRNVVTFMVRNFWYYFVVLPIRIPLVLYAEFLALYACFTLEYCPYPHTLTGIMYTYIPLLFNSAKEVLYCVSILFNAPKTILKDILLQKESLQTITLCGRKSVAWSEPIKIERVKAIAKNTGVSETEVMLAAVSAAISKYFTHTNHALPHHLPVTIRNINSNYVFATGTNVRPEDSMSGILCLNLPILDSEKDVTHLENLLDIKSKFNVALESQGLSHLLTMLQTKFGVLTKFLPATLLSVYLKFLSRKYAVTVTEVTSRYPNVTQKTLWGQEVNGVIYWRPPQANTSISLCFNEYADHVKLGVMCDSQLVPHHSILAITFPDYIQEMAKAVGVY